MNIDIIKNEWLALWAIRIFTNPRNLRLEIKHTKSRSSYWFKITVNRQTIDSIKRHTRDEALTCLVENLRALVDVGEDLIRKDPNYANYFGDGRLITELVLTQEIIDEITEEFQRKGKNLVTTKSMNKARLVA